ncbi:DUF4232 domain-containing protein [Streptomyces sp. NPDC005485]|uniref:DUF4232 domain-containing protein n=1 Tax=Streptomyces sp. NPDC005485 TaxID=3155591 RepID=UPI0033B08D00
MTAIPVTATRSAALACVLVLAASGCGLSAELDRERNPDRSPTPTPTLTWPTTAAPAPVSPLPEPSPTVPVQPAGCPPSGVRVEAGPVDGAMGLRAMTLTLTNCGDKPYKVDGYPAVLVLDETGLPIPGVRTAEGTDDVSMAPPDPGPEPLTLAPGAAAQAGLYWRMNNEDSPYLRVGPAKGRDERTVRLESPLDIGPENVLATTAWRPARATGSSTPAN